jgi:Domain of unknown function (DUF6249)
MDPDYNYIIIPIMMMLMLTVGVIAWLWLNYRAKADHHETLRRALELGQPLDIESLKMHVSSPMTPAADRRGGTIALCVGAAFLILAVTQRFSHGSWIQGEPSLALGLIFCAVGVGRLIAWKIAAKDEAG